MPRTKFHHDFVAPAKAAEALDCSTSYLRAMVNKGWFKLGLHYRDKACPDALQPRYQYNVDAIAQLFATPRPQWKRYTS